MPVFLYGPTQLTLCHGTLLAEKFPQGAACRRPTSVLYPDAGGPIPKTGWEPLARRLSVRRRV